MIEVDMAHLATSSYRLTFRESPIGILVISIGTRVRSNVNRFCLTPPYIAPQLAIQNDVRENHIAHGSLITILNTETTVATFDYAIVDNHIIDGIHILAANLHGTATTLHHTIRYHDVVTGTIFFKLTTVFQADGIIATGDMTVGNAHILAMIDINAITITDLEIVEQIDAVNHYNQREIDVVKEEVMPALKDYDSIGIISPYNNQVDAFNRQMVGTKAGTIHKYQGRENDAIIMSVVDNQITDFADDANMLNVAVSRAKKKFCLVMTGNEQEKHGNIMDLLDYIAYNNCAITESKLASIFDCLYEQYTKQRMSFIENNPQVSEHVSENLTYAMLNEIISSDSRFNVLKVLCHVPLRQVVKDTSFMSEEELRYAANYSTHLDFLIINRVTKLPVLAIETDGYSYHNDQTKQHQRDLMKDHILSCYGLPLLRLSTKGSGEKEKVFSMLQQLT
mgnify:CR=1 FL=1